MELKAVKIKNFRGYRNETTIDFNKLTAFVGKNDAGKSTILEALEIFFNNSAVKIDRNDFNVDASSEGETKIEISCIFTNLPSQLVIDANNPTTLRDENLLNTEGDLEIKKVFSCTTVTPKETVFIVANHPTNQFGNDLLKLKRNELRVRAAELNIPPAAFNANINSSIRAAIWNTVAPLNLATTEIQVDKEDTKNAWDCIEKWMPQFALFKSDRESNDADKEVTDPMKVAINNAIAELTEELNAIQDKVMEKAVDVATRTLEKLKEMNPDLANTLTPNFKADPKWSGLFSLTLAGDKNIPINKRGSGVRRLIVLNFFRAEAERRRNQNNSQAIIYAFEEPENSQHPNHQEMLIKAFKELTSLNNTQVFLTTHNPALAGLIENENLKLVTTDENQNIVILSNQPNIFRQIADTLGMLPSPLSPQLLVCVEGPNDVNFFKIISSTINQVRPDLPDLSTDDRVVIFPLGGSTLKDWVTSDYLQRLNIPQYHIYDLDDQAAPPYLASCNEVRARGGRNWAELTVKREIENYLHPNIIQQVFGFQVAFNDMDDVPEIVASMQHNAASPNPWNTLDEVKKKKKCSQVKRKLNSEVAQLMTWADIQEADPNGDMTRWLDEIKQRIN